jgi:hypothetical protein
MNGEIGRIWWKLGVEELNKTKNFQVRVAIILIEIRTGTPA